MDEHLDLKSVLTLLTAMLGREASVVVLGADAGGQGVVTELTGVLRAVGPDPDDSDWGASGPWVFGFEGQHNAFYLDPDAFVSASGSREFLRIDTTFGAIELAGPLKRPDWF
jgi:hypothetical protein